MKADAPCFLFWPKDWLSSLKVARMSLAAQGAYIRLVSFCWLEETVPSSPDELASVLGVDRETAEGLRKELAPCFQETDSGAWQQPRVERERAKQKADRQQKSNAGKASAQRRGNGRSTDGQRKGNDP